MGAVQEREGTVYTRILHTKSAMDKQVVLPMLCSSSSYNTLEEEEEDAPANQRLWCASTKGDLSEINSSVDDGAHIEARQLQTMRPIRDLDLEGPDIEQLVLLVDVENGDAMRSACPQAEKPMPGLTPLMLAAKEGRSEAVSLLLKMKASPHSMHEDGMQPLHFAASVCCRDSCAALLLARADPRAVDTAQRDAFSCLPHEFGMSLTEIAEWAALFDRDNAVPQTLVIPL